MVSYDKKNHKEQQNTKQINNYICLGAIKPGTKDQNLGRSKWDKLAMQQIANGLRIQNLCCF